MLVESVSAWTFQTTRASRPQRKFTKFTVLALVLTGSAFGSMGTVFSQEAPERIWVEAKALRCIIEHHQKYLLSDQDPILIFTEHCPKVNLSQQQIFEAITNYAPDRPTLTEGEKVSRVITLTKKEISKLVDEYNQGKIDLDEASGVVDVEEHLK